MILPKPAGNGFDARSRVPPARFAYWFCQVMGWGGFAGVNSIAAQSFVTVTSRVVGGYIFLSICGVLVTHTFRAHILRHDWTRLSLPRLAARVVPVNLGLALMLVSLTFAYFYIFPITGWTILKRGIPSAISSMVIFVFNDFIILTFWSLLYFGAIHLQRQRRVESERHQAQVALTEAQLRGLRNQLNPHFFFNSLNSLRALVTEDPERAQSAITQLAAILRYHLQSDERSLVALNDELALVDQYLALELVRFEDRLIITREIQVTAATCLVPPLAVQTLVENAVKHGVSRHSETGELALSAMVHGDQLVIRVRNRGTLELSDKRDTSTGLGLDNLRKRLQLLFPNRSSIELLQLKSNTVETKISLPAIHSLEEQSA